MKIKTDRLILRGWQKQDLEPFASINSDSEVMRYFPAPLTRKQSDLMVERLAEYVDQNGFSFMPVIETATGEMIGMVGLNIPSYPLGFAPCVEVGWRLARSAWGKGYASEAATACIRWGFSTLDIDQVVAFTPLQNKPSQKVMQRIGMQRDSTGDFDHPLLEPDHPLLRHMLYRINRP